jgi:hypothetical protein
MRHRAARHAGAQRSMSSHTVDGPLPRHPGCGSGWRSFPVPAPVPRRRRWLERARSPRDASHRSFPANGRAVARPPQGWKGIGPGGTSRPLRARARRPCAAAFRRRRFRRWRKQAAPPRVLRERELSLSRTLDRPGGCGKRGKERVTGGTDLAATAGGDRRANQAVVVVEQSGELLAEALEDCRRVLDVREQQRDGRVRFSRGHPCT